jgi:Sortase domain
MPGNDDVRRVPPLRIAAAVLAAVLAVAGIAVAVVATADQQTPPSPPHTTAGGARYSSSTTPAAAQVRPNTGTAGTPTAGASSTVNGPILPRSVPVSLTVPRLHLRAAKLVHLGLAKDGSIAVPPTGKNSPASWFTGSPTPGQLGPAVILGHVDSAKAGPAIFYRIGAMRPGDTVSVRRADGTEAVFTVDRVEEYAKARFPTVRVFGNTTRAELRLITCGGHFDPHKHSYENNIVVYAHLTNSHHS